MPDRTNIGDSFRKTPKKTDHIPTMSTEYTYPATNPNAEPGHPGNTTPEDDARVVQLREQLHAEGYTDRTDTNTLLRFLRAVKNEADLVGKAKDK